MAIQKKSCRETLLEVKDLSLQSYMFMAFDLGSLPTWPKQRNNWSYVVLPSCIWLTRLMRYAIKWCMQTTHLLSIFGTLALRWASDIVEHIKPMVGLRRLCACSPLYHTTAPLSEISKDLWLGKTIAIWWPSYTHTSIGKINLNI